MHLKIMCFCGEMHTIQFRLTAYANPCTIAAENEAKELTFMKIRFLGTGAADWNGVDECGEYRRLTSTLFDDALLIDFTHSAQDMLPKTADVRHIFITHSHFDHFDPEAIAALAPAALYAHESWAEEIAIDGIEVCPVVVGKWISAGGYEVLALPSSHSTSRPYEQTVNYLLKKGETLFLYATDGAWLPNRALHLMKGMLLSGMAIDATIGDGYDGDYRIFEHNFLPMIRIMTDTMKKTGLLKPEARVYLTHMARTLHGTQKEVEAANGAPYVVCFDGMETEL